MLRRSLPVVAAAAAAIALAPGVASATPAPAPVENQFGGGYSANASVDLPGGLHADVWLGEFTGYGRYDDQQELYVRLTSEYVCWETYTCFKDEGQTWMPLTGEQVHFSRSLSGVSLAEFDVTLDAFTFDPDGGYPSVDERPATISVVLTGTGDIDRTATHQTMCGDGGRECESIRVDATREAQATVTVDGATGTGTGSLSYMKGLDVAAPKYPADFSG
jgi:hypothetical protein